MGLVLWGPEKVTEAGWRWRVVRCKHQTDKGKRLHWGLKVVAGWQTSWGFSWWMMILKDDTTIWQRAFRKQGYICCRLTDWRADGRKVCRLEEVLSWFVDMCHWLQSEKSEKPEGPEGPQPHLHTYRQNVIKETNRQWTRGKMQQKHLRKSWWKLFIQKLYFVFNCFKTVCQMKKKSTFLCLFTLCV